MKSLLLAAAFAFAPTAAQAAVTINFSGLTLPYESDASELGSYEVVTTSAGITRSIDTEAQAVSGSIVIDTTKIGQNQAVGPDVLYSGKNFVTLTFATTGVTPTILKGALSEQSIDSVNGFSFRLFDEAGTYGYTFLLAGIEPLETSIFDGILLPDFTKASALIFVGFSEQDVGDTSTRRVSSGLVTTITQAVPEPATWAMMLVGFGLVGTALRRRDRVTLRFA